MSRNRLTTFAYRIAVLTLQAYWYVMTQWQTRVARRDSGSEATGTKRVLVLAYNHVTARYVQHIAEDLSSDGRLAVFVCRPPFVDGQVGTSDLLGRLRGQKIGFLKALFTRWDLIITADHYPSALFPKHTPIVFVTHGLFAGKGFGDSSYVYGQRCMRSESTPLYTKMFAASEYECKFARLSNSALDGVVCNTGDVQLDLLVQADAVRGDIRRSMGIDSAKKVVLVASSWGPESLIQKIGTPLLFEAMRLADDYHFIFTVHPNNFSRQSNRKLWKLTLDLAKKRGLTVLDPTEDWYAVLAVADAMVTDYTSLGLYFAELERPMLFAEFDKSDFANGSPMLELTDWAPVLSDPILLQTALEQRFKSYEPQQSIARRPMQARLNQLRELYDVLGLPSYIPPTISLKKRKRECSLL